MCVRVHVSSQKSFLSLPLSSDGFRVFYSFFSPHLIPRLRLEPMQTSFVRHSHSSDFFFVCLFVVVFFPHSLSLSLSRARARARVTQNASLSRKNLTKQLISTEQDQFLCQCEAAVSNQQQPLSGLIDWHVSGFGKCQRENQEVGGPLQLYIYFYIYLN